MTARHALLLAAALLALARPRGLSAQALSDTSPVFTHGSSAVLTTSAPGTLMERPGDSGLDSAVMAPAQGGPLAGTTRRSDRLDLFSEFLSPGQLAGATLVSNLAAATRAGLRADPGASSAAAYSGAISASLVYGAGPAADAWPALTSWASGSESYRSVLAHEALPLTLDYSRHNPFYDSNGNFATVAWMEKAAVLLPTPHGAGRAGVNAARFGVLEMIAGDLHGKQGPPEDFAGFCRTWLKRTANVALAVGLNPLLAPKDSTLQVAQLRRRGPPQFPVTVSYTY